MLNICRDIKQEELKKNDTEETMNMLRNWNENDIVPRIEEVV